MRGISLYIIKNEMGWIVGADPVELHIEMV